MSSSLPDVLHHPAIFRVGEAGPPPRHVVPTGFAALDRALSGGGWPRPGLVELLCDHMGIGEVALMLPTHRALAAHDNTINGGCGMLWVVPPCLPPRIPYAPPLQARAIDLQQLTVVNTTCIADTLWAIEQGLLSNAMGLVMAWLDGARHDVALRRLSQAARASNTLCVLMRPRSAATSPSPAELRIVLSAHAHGELSLDLIKRRGLPHGKTIRIDTRAMRALPCLAPHREPRQIPREVPQKAAVWLKRLTNIDAAVETDVRQRSFEMDR
jgi:hypothetical protein